MFPVTIGLGLINFDLLINSVVGSEISESAPRAIDAAFRIYMLPQGMFSVAVATVLFPALSRLVARRDADGLRSLLGEGTRGIFLLLIPCAACMLVLAEPITRLVYQRGAFGAGSTHEVATALGWFSVSLPLAGVNLLLTRTFFSFQRPWLVTGLSSLTLVLNLIVSIALAGPLGIAGPVIGTVVSTFAMSALQTRLLRRGIGGIDGARTLRAVVQMLLAAAVLAGVSRLVWWAFDDLLGRSLIAQLVSVGFGVGCGIGVYAVLVMAMGVPEARRIKAMVLVRLGGSATA
jgi:putative peptidoglycan lipid II flippase